MAKADIIKFRELLLTDADFQEKLRKAAESYTGDKDEKAVFDKVLTPLGKEYGLSACAIMGAGFGNTGNPNDNCFVIGMGIGICASEGASY